MRIVEFLSRYIKGRKVKEGPIKPLNRSLDLVKWVLRSKRMSRSI